MATSIEIEQSLYRLIRKAEIVPIVESQCLLFVHRFGRAPKYIAINQSLQRAFENEMGPSQRPFMIPTEQIVWFYLTEQNMRAGLPMYLIVGDMFGGTVCFL